MMYCGERFVDQWTAGRLLLPTIGGATKRLLLFCNPANDTAPPLIKGLNPAINTQFKFPVDVESSNFWEGGRPHSRFKLPLRSRMDVDEVRHALSSHPVQAVVSQESRNNVKAREKEVDALLSLERSDRTASRCSDQEKQCIAASEEVESN
jgi:hypothetical protein